MRIPGSALAAASLVLLASCGKEEPKGSSSRAGGAPIGPRPEKIANGEPAVVTVEHILIGVKGGLPDAKREKEEAQRFAFELLGRARSGEDFAKLGREFTEDTPFEPYTMTNTGIAPAGRGERARSGMVKGFGDVGFRLEVGQIGIAEYDPVASKYGYHLIKRVK